MATHWVALDQLIRVLGRGLTRTNDSGSYLQRLCMHKDWINCAKWSN